jgi:NAD(P)-dependent dehydrogenase (short-subunit alcohol dehydrogenase family)
MVPAGATGGVGKRVVQKLLSQGRVVRALVRDVGKAQELLVGLLMYQTRGQGENGRALRNAMVLRSHRLLQCMLLVLCVCVCVCVCVLQQQMLG